MKVIIDTEKNTFTIIGSVLLSELASFLKEHALGEFIIKFEDEEP